MTGGTGFVGQLITEKLLKNQEISDIYITSRSDRDSTHKKIKYIKWNPLDSEDKIDNEIISSLDAVINLMGESIASGRWSEERKKAIYDSRIIGSRNLIDQLNENGTNLKVFSSTSAIGIYEANTGEKINDDHQTTNDNFLAKVCQDWEKVVDELKGDARKVIFRVGVVLGKNGGAMAKMILPFKMGVGGILGDGKQMMSWIHREDLANLYIESIFSKKFNGTYNAVAPDAVTNYDFTKALGRAVKRPTIFPVPEFALKIIFGEMSSVLLDGHNVHPKKLKDQGFEFTHPQIDRALVFSI